MSDIIIDVKNLVTGYGRATILDDISLTLGKGEIHAIIGKSGCGKTTLLKNLLGLMPYRSGSIKVLGVEISDEDELQRQGVRQRTGVLFQRGALLNSMTVAENVALPLEMYTHKTAEEIDTEVRRKLALVNMGHAYGKFPTELSGGMVKRAALARAMALNPEILFCDEPSAGLDPVTTKGIDQLLLSLKAEFNMTVVIVTHDLLSIERIADHLIMLHDRKVAYDGPAKNIQSIENRPIRDFFLLENTHSG